MFARLQCAALAVVGLLGLGCAAQQRAAENLVDPRLRAEGVLLERNGRQPRGELDLGGYTVAGLEITEEAFDGSGPLAPDPAQARGRTRPTQQLRLRFELRPPQGQTQGSNWTSECVGQRRQPSDHDLAAAADELRDEVAIACQLVGPEHGDRWVLQIHGRLADNLRGELRPADAGQGSAQVVEILLWHRLLNVTRRRLPASLALIHGEANTEAALILDSPERAWLARDLSAHDRARLLTAMVSLRLLPLGFDG